MPCEPAAIGDRRQDDHRRMPQREIEADRERFLPVLHQLAHDIIDRCDVVRVDGVTKAEHISQGGGRQ